MQSTSLCEKTGPCSPTAIRLAHTANEKVRSVRAYLSSPRRRQNSPVATYGFHFTPAFVVAIDPCDRFSIAGVKRWMRDVSKVSRSASSSRWSKMRIFMDCELFHLIMPYHPQFVGRWVVQLKLGTNLQGKKHTSQRDQLDALVPFKFDYSLLITYSKIVRQNLTLKILSENWKGLSPRC